MAKLTALAASAALLVVPITAAIPATVQLDSISVNGSDFTFLYGGSLASTEGIIAGSRLVILDFAGYVDGSIFSPYGSILASTELTTSGAFFAPGVTDDPTLTNLVFTYNGPPFQTTPSSGPPYAPIDFSGLSARSIFGGTQTDGFATLTVNNEQGASFVFSAGYVLTPALAPVPEPAVWALMALGFGVVGMSFRRRPRQFVSFA